MWASVERGILVVGPPGSGKGLHLAINAILDAPGPVVTTSTKPDNLKTTLTARDALGPVGVFDPQGMLSPGFAHHVAWDAVAGCDDPMRAATRADALASNTGITGGCSPSTPSRSPSTPSSATQAPARRGMRDCAASSTTPIPGSSDPS